MMPRSHKLPSYVSDLLAAERQAPPPPAEVERRVRARVTAALLATAGTTAAATSLAASPAAAATAAGAAVKTGGLIALGAKVSVLAIGLGVMGTVGTVAYRHHAASGAKTVVAKRTFAHKTASPSREPTRVLALPLPPEPEALPSIPAAPVLHEPIAMLPAPTTAHGERAPVVAVVRAVEVPRKGVEREPGSLAGESPIIDQARTQLAAGNPSLALLLLGQHARRFGHGQLEEEREALWVQALVAKSDGAEARARAVQFRRHFPRSIQIEIVNAAIHSIN